MGKRRICFNYHDFSEGRSNKFTLSPKLFIEHLNRVVELGYTAVNFNSWFNQRESDKFILLTFDDAYSSHFSFIQEELLKRNFEGIFFVPVDFVGRSGHCGWDELKIISNHFEIGSHGMSHTVFSRLSSSALKKELKRSKLDLQEKLGKSVNKLAFPFGRYNQDIIDESLNARFKYLFTTRKVFDYPTESKLIHRLNLKQNDSGRKIEGIINDSSPTFYINSKLSSVKHIFRGMPKT